ncbi:unnamed protein product [Adineta steineri]|uniref:GRAM domain-containing protein n=1 Tax=Adineta steineri TaxID=433720 RepID=A0A813WXK9_9BILA|nr:unnamed protein product [Adineta steineri]
MANNRPASMIVSSNVLDETNTNGSKNILQKNNSNVVRSSNQQKLPGNNIVMAHSSSSSIDSAGAKNAILNEKISSIPPINLVATISSTTTDSELESEQDERYTDDNNSLELNNLPIQNQQQQQLQRRDSGQQKTDGNSSDQLSRRVKHFQKLFKSEIAEEDMPELIDSYVCAYQGDILLQGKMYITDRYLCFHSRIISYVTKHVYRWEQIENVTKERVAFIFPTAIGIQIKPSGKKIIYASFLQRDQAYDKIISICARFNNDTISNQDDDENRLTQGGTLKPTNSIKNKKSKHNNTYEIPDGSEHDNVLQMCLGQDKTNNNNNNNNNKQRLQSNSSKFSNDKQQQRTKKIFNSDKKKSALKNSNNEQDLSIDPNYNISQNNESNRTSRHSKNQQKQTDTILNDDSEVYQQSHNNILSNTHQSHSHDRALSTTYQSNTSSNIISNNDLSIINSHNNGILIKYPRIIILSIISIIKLIIEYLLLVFNQLKTYPIKTSFILLIFVLILIIHSFYLITLAYRIENRLQSLHHLWPSTSSIKNSLPSSSSSSKEL